MFLDRTDLTNFDQVFKVDEGPTERDSEVPRYFLFTYLSSVSGSPTTTLYEVINKVEFVPTS